MKFIASLHCQNILQDVGIPCYHFVFELNPCYRWRKLCLKYVYFIKNTFMIELLHNINQPYLGLPKFMAQDRIQSKFDRIIGGKVASAMIPWQVSISTGGWENMHYCGGSILDSKTILTAKHCYPNEDKKIMNMVRAGSKDNWKGGQLVEVEKWIEYPKKMDPNTNENDIYILKLKTPLKFNDDVKPICLATKDPADGAKCYISGWGVSKTGNMNPERYLKWDSEPIATQKHCEQTFGYSNVPSLICSGGDKANEGTCQGDSGGPLVCLEGGKPVLVGALGMGAGKCEEKNPSLWARVSKFSAWIKANMEK